MRQPRHGHAHVMRHPAAVPDRQPGDNIRQQVEDARLGAMASRSVVGSSARIKGARGLAGRERTIIRCSMPPLISKKGSASAAPAGLSRPTSSIAASSTASFVSRPGSCPGRFPGHARGPMVCSGLKALRGFCMDGGCDGSPRAAAGSPCTGMPSRSTRPAVCLTPGGSRPSAAAQVSDFPYRNHCCRAAPAPLAAAPG